MRDLLLLFSIIYFFFGGLAPAACAQSSALNGQLEGTVTDQTGSSVASASVIATNIENGAVRSASTDENGVFHFPLLSLGTYSIAARATGFRPLVRSGITLLAGQAVNLNLRLEPGGISEAVTVQGDAPIADSAKTDLGRVMNNREVHNIPLPTRNPYNFVILQANVTGHPNRGGSYPQVNVNGFLRRTYWQLDGNTNTRGEKAGARTMFISETYIAEMQLLTPGFAAEFGNTTGMIVNMVTPSGTNGFHGSATYLFNRPSFYARPFFFSGAQLAGSRLDNGAVAIGGPVIRDRWHFYFGHERLAREDNTSRGRQVNISEDRKRELIAAGLPPEIFAASIPGGESASFYILRTDLALNANNHLTARFNHGATEIQNVKAGLDTWERSTDTRTTDHAVSLQLLSFSPRVLNEFRFQFVRSRVSTIRNENSGTGIAVNILNAANFGSPGSGTDSITKDTQVQDNLTWTRGTHAIRFGGGFIALDRFSRASTSALYTFRSIDAWVRAKSGVAPYGYVRYEETFGEPEAQLEATYWNAFLQDEWKPTGRIKLNYGLRYDLYLIPAADPSAPFFTSRAFKIDKNNFAPRLGLVYALSEGERPLVLRAGAGMYFEPPWTDMYTKALRENGAATFFTRRFCGENGGTTCPRDSNGPAFPHTFSGNYPPGVPLPPQDIITIAPDFENMFAVHSNLQLEQALTNDLSVSIGYLHSAGRHIPVYRSINWIDPIRFLADGRPVFGAARLDPRFNTIQIAESAGVSQYDALTLQVSRRYSRGIQFSANYTLSRAVDDAPEQDVTYDDGGVRLRALSDPTNRSLDRGYSYGDQRHTFVMSLVARPNIYVQSRTLRVLLNNNQFGLISRASSGERFTVRIAGDVDLNGDGLFWPDRPVGIKRNAGKTPTQFNLDLRYLRRIDLSERFRLEFFGEVQNLFNINNIIAFTDVSVPVDPQTGRMIGPMPDFRARNAPKSLESRQIQIGVKFIF